MYNCTTSIIPVHNHETNRNDGRELTLICRQWSTQKQQHVQNNAARILLQAPRRCHANPLLRHLHWLPVHHRINYKLAVMTYKIHSTGLLAQLSRHINRCESTRTLRSSDTLLLTVSFTKTLVCSLILTTLDYCNSLLSGSHSSSIQTQQRVQNNAARIVLQAPRGGASQTRCCASSSVCRFVTESTTSWLWWRYTGLPAHLSHHINPDRETTRTLRSYENLLFPFCFRQ